MNETKEIPIDKIRPSPYQPRIEFDLEDLKGSILRDGILVPITVRKITKKIMDVSIPSDVRKEIEEIESYYELIDGERRTRLAKELGHDTIPATIIDVDNDTARRMVWKLNVERKDYTPKEKALYFKKLQESGMSARNIAREFYKSGDHHTVIAYLNIFRLPEKYQICIWNGDIPIGIIRTLESLLNGGGYPPQEVLEILDKAATQKHFTAKEAQEAIRPYLKARRQKQIDAAKEILEKIEPVVEPPESPDELRKAAEALKREAKRKEKAKKTPEQIEEERLEKERKKREYEEKRKSKRESERRLREERERKIREEAEAQARTEAQAKAQEKIEEIREVAKQEAKEELKKDREFIREVTKEVIKPPLYKSYESDKVIWEPPKTIDNPLRYLSIGLKFDLFNIIHNLRKNRNGRDGCLGWGSRFGPARSWDSMVQWFIIIKKKRGGVSILLGISLASLLSLF